jgi:hypothetical protein
MASSYTLPPSRHNLTGSMRENEKLSNQRMGSFRVIRKSGTLAYELDSPGHWKIHQVISVSQLELTNTNDPFDRVLPGQPLAVLQDSGTAE